MSLSKVRFAVLAWAGVMASGAQAVDLEQAYRDAVTYDATLSGARASLAAGREKLPQGRAGLLPTISLSGNTNYNTAVFNNLDPHFTSKYNSHSWIAQLNQPLFRWQNWVQYKQTWRSRPPVDGKPARFILTRVVEFDANQVELRTIEMVNDGTRPSYVSIPLAGKSRLYKILDDKGSVVRSEIKEGDALISSESPAVAELISFEKRLFLHDNPVEIPNYDFYEAGAPAWIYDYEDTQYPRMKPN